MTSRREHCQTDAQGKRTAVVLPIADYERMLNDLHDLAIVAERPYRFRAGSYRVVYRVDDTDRVVTIRHIRHHRNAYRR